MNEPRSDEELEACLPAVLIGGQERTPIEVVDHDPAWPELFTAEREKVHSALGGRERFLEHIGSTSVPGLAAKSIIDILLVVEDAADEPAYLPALEGAGYVLRVREPHWHEHRMLRTPARDVHVHVFSPDSPEIGRNPPSLDAGIYND